MKTYRVLTTIEEVEDGKTVTRIVDESELGTFDTEEEAKTAIGEILDALGYEEEDDENSD